jgi:hypothetical protein
VHYGALLAGWWPGSIHLYDVALGYCSPGRSTIISSPIAPRWGRSRQAVLARFFELRRRVLQTCFVFLAVSSKVSGIKVGQRLSAGSSSSLFTLRHHKVTETDGEEQVDGNDTPPKPIQSASELQDKTGNQGDRIIGEQAYDNRPSRN